MEQKNTFEDVLVDYQKEFGTDTIDVTIFENRFDVIGKTVSPDVEKRIFGFSVSDVKFK